MKQPVSTTICVLFITVTAAHAQASGARYDAAQEAYAAGHYRDAFETFAGLADQGHCDAARIASQMARWGQPLYAQTFQVSPERRRQWQLQPACAATTTTAAASAARR